MDKNKLYEIADKLEEEIGTDELLLALLKALDGNDLEYALEAIDGDRGTGLFDE